MHKYTLVSNLLPIQSALDCTTPTTRSPKSQKGNYFLIDSLLSPAHSSEPSVGSTYKEHERTPVLSGCSSIESLRNTPIFDITKRSEVVAESDVARAPAQASVLSPHHSNGQEVSNSSTPMRKLKREPDEQTATTTMTPPPNICVDDELANLSKAKSGVSLGYPNHNAFASQGRHWNIPYIKLNSVFSATLDAALICLLFCLTYTFGTVRVVPPTPSSCRSS
ncbi:hypothetical protein Y032_0515g2780 [Ancylostoma ceylanicum]|nr:hypothetical protein Y032_0515g2780 [Ancylostoma ceylanicum]